MTLITERAGCLKCEALMINGVFCHEIGCPDANKGRTLNCHWCGTKFKSEGLYQRCCSHSCHTAYEGITCDCDDCRLEDV